MSASRYFVGLVLLILILLGHGAAGLLAQRMLPRRHWSVHALAGVVVGLGGLVFTAQMLGAVGLFSAPACLVAAWVCAGGALVLSRRMGPPAEVGPVPSPLAKVPAPLALLVGLGTFGAAVRWIAAAGRVLVVGIEEVDSNTYHLPFAAQFVRTGWTTRFHHLWPDPVHVFYPANAELVQAVTMSAMGRDVLVPLVNLGWLAVLLLAAWCAGARDGVAPVTLAGGVWIASIPLVLYTQAGSALTDIPMLAGLLAAVALWRNADGDLRWQWLSAVALGLSVGTKLTVLPVAGAIAIGLLITAESGRRARTLGVVASGMAVGGGVWFVRNLLRAGSPLPHLSLPLLPSVEMPVVDRFGHPVLHYLTDLDVWRATFRPGLVEFFGLAGLVAAAAAAIAVVGLRRRDSGRLVLLGAVALGGVGYLLMPAGAWVTDGTPDLMLFTANLRYLLPALVLLPLVAAWASADAAPRWPIVCGSLLTVAGLLNVARSIGFDPPPGYTRAAVAAVAAALLTVAFVRRWPRLLPVAGVGSVLALAFGAVVMGPVIVSLQLAATSSFSATDPVGRVMSWARNEDPERVGIYAFDWHYRIYGPGWTTNPIYLGVEEGNGGFRSASTCEEFIGVLERAEVDHAVLGPPDVYGVESDLPGWALTQAGAEVVIDADPYFVISVPDVLDPALCGYEVRPAPDGPGEEPDADGPEGPVVAAPVPDPATEDPQPVDPPVTVTVPDTEDLLPSDPPLDADLDLPLDPGAPAGSLGVDVAPPGLDGVTG